MPKLRIDLSRISLESLRAGRPFEGMAAGEFIDMWGRKAVFRKEDLARYVANTKAALEFTRDETGELVGFPIDAMNHDHGQSAGWVVDVNLNEAGDKILFTPRWTDIGIDVISRRVMRFFSPEINPISQVIAGGSLTNWPATRTKKEEILLRPIVLSKFSEIDGAQSMNERMSAIVDAFDTQYGNDFTQTWVMEVFDDFIICRDGDKLYKVEYTESEDGVTFSTRDLWVEVKRSYIEAAMEKISAAIKSVLSGLLPVQEEEETPGPIPEPEDSVMTDVTPEMRSAVLAQLASGSELPAELAAFVDQKANERMTALLAVEQRKRDTVALASRLVGGTAEAPNGLPVDKDQLASFLLSLSPEQAEQASAILEKIQSAGLVSFAEVGHGRELEGKTPLPQYFADALDAGKIQLTDLSNPILGLGDPSQYDLSKWSKEQ